MSDNPASIIFNKDGYEVGAFFDNTEFDLEEVAGLTISGTDGYVSRLIRVTESGSMRVTPSPSREAVGRYYQGSNLIVGDSIDQNLFSIYNPFGSGRIVYINRISVNGVVTETFTSPFLYKVRRSNGAPSNGSVLNTEVRSTLDSAHMAVVRESPDGYVESGIMWSSSPGVNTTNGSSNTNVFEALNTEDGEFEFALQQGEGMIIEAEANSSGWRHWVNVVWNEVIDPNILEPDDILGSMHTWLRMDSVATTGSDIDTLLDKSGNGRNFPVDPSSGKATLVSESAGFNNKPIATFTSSTGYRFTSKTVYNFMHDGSPNTFIAILKPQNTNSGTFNIFRSALGTGTTGVEYLRDGTPQRLHYRVIAAPNGLWNPTLASSGLFATNVLTIVICEFEYNRAGNDFLSEIGGIVSQAGEPSFAPDAGDNWNGPYIGSVAGSGGETMELAEIIILDRLMTDEEKSAIETYANVYYGV